MNLNIRKKEQIVFAPQFRDADGNLTTDLGSVPVWTSSNTEVLIVTATVDGLIATAVPTGALGSAQIRLVVDADPGTDVVDLIGTADVTVKAGMAVYIELNPTISAVVVPAPTPVAVSSEQVEGEAERGLTTSIIHIDESPFQSNIETVTDPVSIDGVTVDTIPVADAPVINASETIEGTTPVVTNDTVVTVDEIKPQI